MEVLWLSKWHLWAALIPSIIQSCEDNMWPDSSRWKRAVYLSNKCKDCGTFSVTRWTTCIFELLPYMKWLNEWNLCLPPALLESRQSLQLLTLMDSRYEVLSQQMLYEEVQQTASHFCPFFQLWINPDAHYLNHLWPCTMELEHLAMLWDSLVPWIPCQPQAAKNDLATLCAWHDKHPACLTPRAHLQRSWSYAEPLIVHVIYPHHLSSILVVLSLDQVEEETHLYTYDIHLIDWEKSLGQIYATCKLLHFEIW